MRPFFAFLALAIASSAYAAPPTQRVDWSDLTLYVARLPEPHPRLKDAKLAKFYGTQFRRAFGRPGATAFSGYSKVLSIKEADEHWIVTAEAGITDAQKRRRMIREMFPEDGPNGTSSAAGLAGLAAPAANGFDRKAIIRFLFADKPKFESGEQLELGGSLVGAHWTPTKATVEVDAN